MMFLLITALLFCSDRAHARKIPLTHPGILELWSTRAEIATYHGRRALKLTENPAGSGQLLAILHDLSFHNGTIEIDVAGALSETAAASDRGFIGIAFRVQPNKSRYECIYVRPAN